MLAPLLFKGKAIYVCMCCSFAIRFMVLQALHQQHRDRSRTLAISSDWWAVLGVLGAALQSPPCTQHAQHLIFPALLFSWTARMGFRAKKSSVVVKRRWVFLPPNAFSPGHSEMVRFVMFKWYLKTISKSYPTIGWNRLIGKIYLAKSFSSAIYLLFANKNHFNLFAEAFP